MSQAAFLKSLRRKLMLAVHPDLAPSAHASKNTTFMQQLSSRLGEADFVSYAKGQRIQSPNSAAPNTPTHVFVKGKLQSINLDVPVSQLLLDLQTLAAGDSSSSALPPPPPPSTTPSNDDIMAQFAAESKARMHHQSATPSTTHLSLFLENVPLDTILQSKLWLRRARFSAREVTRRSGCRSIDFSFLNYSAQNTNQLLKRLSDTFAEYHDQSSHFLKPFVIQVRESESERVQVASTSHFHC